MSISAKQREWMESYARFGYMAKGVVYLTVGLTAGWAALNGVRPEGSEAALSTILEQPFGQAILLVVGVGLLGYSCWKFVQAIRDTEFKGTDASGILQRGGYAASGFIHLALAFFCGQAVWAGGQVSGGEGPQSLVAKLLNQPFGQALVGLVGLALIGVGLFRLHTAFSKAFRQRMHLEEMSERERTWAVRSGQFGIAARSVVFALTGYFFLKAAQAADASQAGALRESLMAIQDQGTWYLTAMALGLLAYAVHLVFLARYRHIETGRA